jgi:hypothetical protein
VTFKKVPFYMKYGDKCTILKKAAMKDRGGLKFTLDYGMKYFHFYLREFSSAFGGTW